MMISSSEEKSDSSDSTSFYSVIDTDSKFGSFHSINSVEYHKRSNRGDRPVFKDCVAIQGCDEGIAPNSDISLPVSAESIVKVIMSENSGTSPQSDAKLSKESEKKKKGLRFSLKKKKSSKKDGKESVKDSGTESDLSSSNPVTPQLTPQGTLEKNISAPWKSEHSDGSKGEPSNVNQVSGKEKTKKFGSFLPFKKTNQNLKLPLFQITPEVKTEERLEEKQTDCVENLSTEIKGGETVPDRVHVLEKEIRPVSSDMNTFHETMEYIAPINTVQIYPTSQDESVPLEGAEGIDIAEGPSRSINLNSGDSQKASDTTGVLKSIALEIAEAEKLVGEIMEIKSLRDARSQSSRSIIKEEKSTMKLDETKAPVQHSPPSPVEMKSFKSSEPSNDDPVPNVDEVTTRKKVTLVTMSGKPKEPEISDSVSTYPLIGTKVKNSYKFAGKNHSLNFNAKTSQNMDDLVTPSVPLNTTPKKIVSVDSFIKADTLKTIGRGSPIRIPQPLTQDHYAPFGSARKPKNRNNTLSRSFSNETSEKDGDKKSLQSSSTPNHSYSNLYLKATETSYDVTDGGSSTSGKLSDSWAFSSSDKKEHLYKILVIGELGTGKTSIIKRYVHQFFCQHYRATIGVDFALKVLNWDENTVIRLQLWDIAGQERFGNMTRVYYKQAVGAFIVFDVSNGKSFDAVTKWKNDLDTKVTLPDGSNIPAVLLANKCDQPKEGVVTTPAKMDDYCRERKFAGWFETSAKEDINIDEATKFLISKILNNENDGLLIDEIDKEKFSIEMEKPEETEEKKCLC